MPRYYDMHCHLHEIRLRDVNRILELERSLVIVAVSDDLESFIKTIELSSEYPDRIVPCAGFHPWNIGERSLGDVDEVLRTAYRLDVPCIGEVGLDKKFVPQTIDLQRVIFEKFLRAASDMDVLVNIHAPDAWKDVISLIMEYDIGKAIIHWYTGPLNFLNVLRDLGVKITVNPAVTIQKKHRRVVQEASLEMLVLESDAPYNYRGLNLNPLMIKRSVEEIALIKGVSPDLVAETVAYNSEKLLGHL
ncbi:MAG: TatD family hydrolase [Desulfurococcales archaeon]|nr:TatD family hydrolase [Desulfurococcales archaeon]